MAKTKTYPKIARKIWWLLRDRFKKSMPTTVSATFITSLAQMNDASAKSNVLNPLRELGLIDAANKPLPIAEKWRHDDEYKAVCHEIRANVYPHELIEAFSEPEPNQRDSIRNWFMKEGQVGEAAARMFTDTYLLLSEAEVSKADENSAAAIAQKAPRPTATNRPRTTAVAQDGSSTKKQTAPTTTISETEHTGQHRRLPAIHIDVQVHITPDTTPEQIDRIFESMAKHLGGFVK